MEPRRVVVVAYRRPYRLVPTPSAAVSGVEPKTHLRV
jgi:hypothetical protein